MLFLKNFKKLKQIVWEHLGVFCCRLCISAKKSDAFIQRNQMPSSIFRRLIKKWSFCSFFFFLKKKKRCHPKEILFIYFHLWSPGCFSLFYWWNQLERKGVEWSLQPCLFIKCSFSLEQFTSIKSWALLIRQYSRNKAVRKWLAHKFQQ